jgi:hypothetical protein
MSGDDARRFRPARIDYALTDFTHFTSPIESVIAFFLPP